LFKQEFSRANLYRMKRFYAFYASQDESVAQAVRRKKSHA